MCPVAERETPDFGESGQISVTQEKTAENNFHLGYRQKSIAGVLGAFLWCIPRELCIARKGIIRNGCLVST